MNSLTTSENVQLAAPVDITGAIETDAVIVGAGPVGLFQVFELGLLEIKAHVVDSLNDVGGQCVELYPDKPIYDIPAVPVCTGKELTDSLLKQIEPFGASFHLGQEVSVLQKQADGRFFVETIKGTRFLTKVVIIAAGVGSFQPRTLKVPGIEKFLGAQLFYRVKDPAQFHGKSLVIAGGGDSALDWALDFAGKAESIVLVHRRDGFRAAPASVARMKELCEKLEMQFLVGQISGFEEASGRMTDVRVTSLDGLTRRVPLDALLVFFGLSPKLGPIADWGLDLERKQILVDTEKIRDQRVRHLCGRRHQPVSGQEEADLVGLPRGRTRRLRGDEVRLPRTQGAPCSTRRRARSCTRFSASSPRSSTDRRARSLRVRRR